MRIAAGKSAEINKLRVEISRPTRFVPEPHITIIDGCKISDMKDVFAEATEFIIGICYGSQNKKKYGRYPA